jgi:GNAT superfamily N-acetyltransferase
MHRRSTASRPTAFAVDDRFHGKGIATSMLERSARIATAHGFRWFEASTLARKQRDARRLPRFLVRSALEVEGRRG